MGQRGFVEQAEDRAGDPLGIVAHDVVLTHHRGGDELDPQGRDLLQVRGDGTGAFGGVPGQEDAALRGLGGAARSGSSSSRTR